MHQVFEKQCGYQAKRVRVMINKQVDAPGQNEQPNSSLHFIILIFFSHTDLVAPVVVIKTALQEG